MPSCATWVVVRRRGLRRPSTRCPPTVPQRAVEVVEAVVLLVDHHEVAVAAGQRVRGRGRRGARAACGGSGRAGRRRPLPSRLPEAPGRTRRPGRRRPARTWWQELDGARWALPDVPRRHGTPAGVLARVWHRRSGRHPVPRIRPLTQTGPVPELWDLIVVGAGPAGGLRAHLLRRRRHRRARAEPDPVREQGDDRADPVLRRAIGDRRRR